MERKEEGGLFLPFNGGRMRKGRKGRNRLPGKAINLIARVYSASFNPEIIDLITPPTSAALLKSSHPPGARAGAREREGERERFNDARESDVF